MRIGMGDGHRAGRGRKERLGAPLTRAMGLTPGDPDARAVADSSAQPLAESSSGGSSALVRAAEEPCEVAG
jgi:hypothetical protein